MISKNFKTHDALPTELDSKNTLIFVFYSKQNNSIKELQKKFPQSTIVGCSSAGEIFNNTIVDDVVISINKFETASFQVFYENICAGDSFSAGNTLAKKIYTPDLKGSLILSNGLKINGSQLISGLKEIIKTPIFGGLAGDGIAFVETSILYKGEFQADGVIGIGFYGDVQFDCGTGGGWIKFGPMRKVTKTENNKIYELDEKPALDLYKHYLGKEDIHLPTSALYYPLCFQTADGREITRSILSVDELEKSITLAGDIPKGSPVRLMHADYTELVSGAAKCALELKNKVKPNSFSMAVSCVGRRMVLGEYTESELDPFLELQSIKNLVGFYSYGELAPIKNKSNGELHNQSIALLNIKEFSE